MFMNIIFFILISISIIAAIVFGRVEELNEALFAGCNLAVKIALSLIGIMSFWLGIMRIAEKSNLLNLLSKILYPVIKPLFKDLKKDGPTIGNITMSICANALGLTNAATPIGLKVMKELQEENPKKNEASDSMCMFLAMNTAGFQIIPATVIAILVGIGAKNPFEIVIPTLIVTTISFCFQTCSEVL